jgi:hypothetical protein
MSGKSNGSTTRQGMVYEVRALTNRWLSPMGSEVISSHTSAKAAMDAFAREPQEAKDGSGRTTHGSYVAKVVVCVDAQGKESVLLPEPHGEGLLTWPYTD